MKIQNMFQKDINRDINGVVKVSQSDQHSLEQELSEYIITKELRRHFDTFFENYTKAIDYPTDKIGVWISGFFGSGKSHFLKMLSYLLSNKEVAGKHAFDYFADKFDDPMMYANVQKSVRIPTESILFNIDIEGPINKDKTAVLRVFAKVFYNHCGFYGEDLKIAKLERFIDRQGKTEAFRAAFREINGDDWVNVRDSAAFFEDDVVETLQSVLGMSETAARNWFNGEENADMSIKQLVADIKEYVDSKGDPFRLLFCVDEVGQYIGEDGDLMMNLQSLVEEIGDKCRGKVWVMVTSQEAIDSVVKVVGNDFSKIQGRFNTRLSLSSSSVDEVIKKRVLAKTEDADQLLRMEYEKEASGLKSLFAFDNPILDIKGFADAKEFSDTFPFVPYQFIIIQKVLAEIRKHGNSGKHLSGGERSMLSGFQEAAQKIEGRDENALVPFYQFYDTVHTFLESAIRRVIDRCQNAADAHDGLEQQDVAVLKLLYLVRYIDDIKSNIENISILMIDDIHTDKIALRASITASLERLLSQNYIARNGDNYSFLTDEEQDIAIDIKNTAGDSAQIVQSIMNTVYGEIYPAKKFKFGRYDFAYDQFVDETLNGADQDDFTIAGSGANNEEALSEISQWLELQNQKMLKTSMGDVQRRYQGIPYGWKEIDIAAVIARLIVQQKIQIQYGGAVIARDDRRLVDFLRKKSEIDKAIVARRIAPSESLMRQSVTSLREYLNAMDIPSDEDGLIRFVLDTFEGKLRHYDTLLNDFYAKDTYPEKELVTEAREQINDVLSQRKDNVTLLRHMVEHQDDLLDMQADMEDVEMFFKTQRVVFDSARKCLESISRERDYFAADADAQNAVSTISAIVTSAKPYKRIGELPELVQNVKTAYGKLLEMKREEVAENIRQCMEDVHQLAGEVRGAEALLHQADDHFAAKRETAQNASSLTELDAMTTQLLTYKDTVCRRMEALHEEPQTPSAQPNAPIPRLNIKPIRRMDLCPAKRLRTQEDIDRYVEEIRAKLTRVLENSDGVQIQ